MSKTDYRSLYTKNIIKQNFVDLLKIKPFEKITVAEICRLAGINRGTFYLHFIDIYDLLEQMEIEVLDQLVEELKKCDSVEYYYNELFLNIYKIFNDNKEISLILISLDNPFKSFEKVINYAKGKTYNDMIKLYDLTESQADWIFTCLVYGSYGITKKWLSENNSGDFAEIQGIITEFISNGITGFKTV